jgi:hypothetical protein
MGLSLIALLMTGTLSLREISAQSGMNWNVFTNHYRSLYFNLCFAETNRTPLI